MITITAGNLRNNTLPLATVLDLFPSDALGGPTTATKSKHPVEIIVYGRDEPVRTDIPTDPKTGKARPMFRSRAWVADFFKRNNLAAGDEIAIEALRPRLFSLRPAAIEVNCNRQAVFSFQERRKAVSRPAPKRELTFIDLFAGIGGLRLGMEQAGLKCVFSSEWDKHSQKTYEAWYGERPHGDITQISPESIPDHDVLVGGFPCQPFSIAGVSKKNALGRAHGFLDATQGTLFFNVAKIIEVKRPRAFILENVKNLRSHDKGNTWRVIESTLRGLGYQTFAKIIDAAGWVPQHRERIFIVGFDTQRFGKEIAFDFPTPPAGRPPRFRDILEPRPPAKYTLTDHLWTYLQNYAKKHAAKGNGFGFGMTNLDGVSRTLSARYYKDGSEVLIPQKNGKNPRRLTPTEARRLMGFPDHLPIVVSDTQAYRQFGNAVVPKVAHAVGVELVNSLNELVEIRVESEIARVG